MIFKYELYIGVDVMNINERVETAKFDLNERENLIREYTPFIIKQLSNFLNKYIDDKNSDELSIGLMAFNEAIEFYDYGKGSFLNFSTMLIKRRVIDYLRKNYSENTIPIEMYCENKDDYESENRMLEMISFKSLLSLYNITIKDLVKESPKHKDTREIALKIAQTICNSEKLLKYLKIKKVIPIKEIVKILNINKKTIERHRKYIIALVIIISEDLPILKQYLNIESEVPQV
ncbi:RNA polymerase sigma factor [Thermoanaerobacterium sp. RBIITD]|nr:RNA polymerase sigma factor [Thermoanaerobacterium sp. RBIITD]